MKFENTEVMGFEGAMRGMRNPLDSWAKSDSYFGLVNTEYTEPDFEIAANWAKKENPELYGEHFGEDEDERIVLEDKYIDWLLSNGILKNDFNNDVTEVAFVGPNDMDLAQRLIKSGPEHCKFLRQIFVSVNITAPLYWWKEADTYKIGTTANSTSTMHTLTKYPITIKCFEIEDISKELLFDPQSDCSLEKNIIPFLENLRLKYLETKDKRYWKELVRWLPEGWLQKRTWTCSYANLRNIYHQRKNHKLTEWHKFCEWIESLPYAKELIIS